MKHDPRFVGTFVSDKEATMSYLKGSGKFNDRQLALFDRLLGKLRVECDGVTIVSTLDDFTDREPLRIIKRGTENGSEYIVTETELLGDKIQHKVIFTEDGYWLVGGMAGPDYREKFRRVGNQSRSE